MQGCTRSYCAKCRALWHEGDCAQLGEDPKVGRSGWGSGSSTSQGSLSVSSQVFPLDKDWMEESSWRQ